MKKSSKPLSVKAPNYNSFNPTMVGEHLPSRVANQLLSDHKIIDNFNNPTVDRQFD